MTEAVRCPVCGADLGGNFVCHRCGTLVGVEMILRRVASVARAFVAGQSAKLPQRIQAYHFLWACALIPLFVLPPLVSLGYSVRAMRRAGGGRFDANFEWIAIISAINIVVSVLVLYKLHLVISDLTAHGEGLLRALIKRWFDLFAPSNKPDLFPKLTPA